MVRVQPDLAARIDAWSKKQGDEPSRPEAIRRLVERALEHAEDASDIAEAMATMGEKTVPAYKIRRVLGIGAAKKPTRKPRKKGK